MATEYLGQSIPVEKELQAVRVRDIGLISFTPSTKNYSVTPLGANQTYTGESEWNGYTDVGISCYTDVAGTLYFQFQNPGSSYWHAFPSAGFAVAAGVHEFHVAVKLPRMFRVVYVNGSSAQSVFELYAYYGTFRQPNLPLNASIGQDADAATVRAITEEVAIAGGLFQGYSIVNKFGTNPDIDTTSAPEDIWDHGAATTTYPGFPDSTLETISILSNNAADTSGGTGAQTVSISGLDSNYNPISETVTLKGTTPVATVNQYRRANTATVQSAGSGGVNAGLITARHTTTTANVFLNIVAGRNQSNTSAYTVPAGYTAHMRSLHCAFRGSSTGTADGYIWTREFGKPFRARRPFAFGASFRLADTIFGGLTFTEKSDIVLRITSVSANNTSVNGGYDLLLVKN